MQQYKGLSDDELIALVKSSDDLAFEEIYNRYWKRMLSVAANKVERIEDAEEIVQDIFVSLWNRREAIEIKSSLDHYLAVAVKYKVIKALDKNSNKQKYIAYLGSNGYVDDSTREWLEFEELKNQLSLWVGQLPEKCRIVYQLSREVGFSQKEIAQHLNIAEKTVEAHIVKATKVLRAKLAHIMVSVFLFFLS
ncbi:RNA polymerase sigma-70 factor [Olivibacter sitiensis]|uniref:RNA polymerase sigma-70 factor n=1 Tax=Olivibacter sitiensis TaxID=376470 RepID=UPI00040D1520|nr:RNA polymerase sigma-70 factor [Olivibacter sitiensis]